MQNRETTYYSLLSSENLRHIEDVADNTPQETFIELGFEKKWLHHLWIGANNEVFLDSIRNQDDLQKLDMILGEQLKLYARKQGEGYEKDKGGFYQTYKARKDWLNNTVFLCKNEYNKTKNEVYNEVVKWCEDWQSEWLETFNPYSPKERQEMSKDLKKPLWQELNNEGEAIDNKIEYDLDKTIWKYDAYVKNCRYNFDNSEKIRKLSRELNDIEIYNISHRAVQELKSMALSGNPQFENTANYYFTKCRKILDEHQKNIKDNNLNHVEVMPKIRDYFDTMQPLYNFHDEVLLLLPKLKEQLEQNEVLPPQQSEKQKPKQETPKTFDELFYNTDLVIPCVDILKELDPPLIDTDYNYIGKLKGVFCVWIDEMKRQGVVKSNYPEERKLFAELIPQKIKRFSIDESMFGKYQKKAEDNYRTEIKTKISNIKLSQNSQ